MPNRLEQFRRRELRPRDPLYRHPVNWKMAKDILGRRRRGTSHKVENAVARKQAQDEFIQGLPKFQFERALGHILDGQESREDIEYVAKNIGMHEKVIKRFRISSNVSGEKRARRRVTVSIVDFTRRDSV